ncbi:MAG: hypothetical protein CMJ87_06240 [Planctomycetes bacterium]|nr:hypothetical protein [Planctomycetota bacterium]
MVVNRRIVSSRFPYVPIRLEVRQRAVSVEALLDTGFDGAVVVPRTLVMNGMPPHGEFRLTLADGSSVLAPYYRGTLQLGEMEPFRVNILVLGNESIIGLAAINRYYIGLDHGQRVIVEP